MKNTAFIIFVVMLLFAVGCDDIPSEVFDAETSAIKAVKLNSPDKVNYNIDPVFSTEVTVDDADKISSIWFDLYFAEGRKEEVSKDILLKDDGYYAVSGDQTSGDNIFSARYQMLEEYTSGRYQAQYRAKDIYENTFDLGSVYFEFETGVENFPPVISNLVMADTVRENEYFTFTLQVEDPNGLSDISRVYFLFFRPDGSNMQPNGVDMKDDGDSNFGDASAGDGIFSFRNRFGGEGLQYGTWKAEFYAKDKSGSISNIITHNIEVMQ